MEAQLLVDKSVWELEEMFPMSVHAASFNAFIRIFKNISSLLIHKYWIYHYISLYQRSLLIGLLQNYVKLLKKCDRPKKLSVVYFWKMCSFYKYSSRSSVSKMFFRINTVFSLKQNYVNLAIGILHM